MTRMAEENAKKKKSRGLVLKSSIPSTGERDEESAQGSESKNLTLIVRKFKKFMNKNPKGGSFQHKKKFKKNYSNSSNFNCFEWDKPSHIKSKCFIFLKKQ